MLDKMQHKVIFKIGDKVALRDIDQIITDVDTGASEEVGANWKAKVVQYYAAKNGKMYYKLEGVDGKSGYLEEKYLFRSP